MHGENAKDSWPEYPMMCSFWGFSYLLLRQVSGLDTSQESMRNREAETPLRLLLWQPRRPQGSGSRLKRRGSLLQKTGRNIIQPDARERIEFLTKIKCGSPQ